MITNTVWDLRLGLGELEERIADLEAEQKDLTIRLRTLKERRDALASEIEKFAPHVNSEATK